MLPACHFGGGRASVTWVNSKSGEAAPYRSILFIFFDGRPAAASLDELLARLERGKFGLVAVGRALLQDPAWLAKIREGGVNQIGDSTSAAFATLS
jgi:2,4-dienoyl-CoA reductase-like NADH-dependent reductase (Old Yellow Enzyme family)